MDMDLADGASDPAFAVDVFLPELLFLFHGEEPFEPLVPATPPAPPQLVAHEDPVPELLVASVHSAEPDESRLPAAFVRTDSSPLDVPLEPAAPQLEDVPLPVPLLAAAPPCEPLDVAIFMPLTPGSCSSPRAAYCARPHAPPAPARRGTRADPEPPPLAPATFSAPARQKKK